MRYQVPQFVDIEDKIIGPLTLKQFLMYLVAVMCLIPVYIASDLSLFITIALPILGIAAAFAHIKIGNKSLATTVVNAVNHTLHGQLYLWRRTLHTRPLLIKDPNWQQSEADNAASRAHSLNQIAQNLETQGNTVKAPEVEDMLG
jgi:hypothetical protein